MSAPFGYVSVTDTVLPTYAIMGDNPANATQNADAWGEAVNYAKVNGLLGVFLPLGIMPVDAVCEMDGADCLSVRGMGRLRSQIKKYGNAVSSVSENDPNRTNNTRLGFNVTYPNAVLHIYNQWSDGTLSDFGLISDGDAVTSNVEHGLVVHGISQGEAVQNLFIQGFTKCGYVDLYPTITTPFRNIRIDRVGYGATFWSHNQCGHDIVYPSRFRHNGIHASLDGGYMEACPVELGGHDCGMVQTEVVPIAYALYNCRQAEIRGCIGESNIGAALQMSGNDGLDIRNMLILGHSSNYTGALPRVFVAYAAGCNKTTIDLKVEYKSPALSGGASLGKHYDFGGDGLNTGTTLIRNEYGGGWGNKSSGAL